jgi:LPXTG-motif cell wall-anchored protein
MSIVNRRNALLGWAAWTVGKRVARRKAREAAPRIDRETKKPNRGLILSGLAAAGGALWFWRKRRGGDDAAGGSSSG